MVVEPGTLMRRVSRLLAGTGIAVLALVGAGTSAGGGEQPVPAAERSFGVVVGGLVSVRWQYTTPALEIEDCRETTTYEGFQTVTIRSARALPVTVRRAGGRVRFVRATLAPLRGTVQTGGTKSVARECADGESAFDIDDCSAPVRTFRRASVVLALQRGALVLREVRGLPRTTHACAPPPGGMDPNEVGLHRARGRVTEATFLTRTRVRVRGTYARARRLSRPETGQVAESARWTMTFVLTR